MSGPLFIFEMANNHMGDVRHGVALVRAVRDAVEGFGFDMAFKVQYRSLDTFIHASARGRGDLKHVRRFEETRLTPEEFAVLLAEMRACGFSTVCTPYDERSVDLLEQHGVERVKVASCSLTDWPLLETIARTRKPVIVSTAGARPEEIDNVVSFFLHRGLDLTILHCVAEYPTEDERLHLSRIDLLRRRYPDVRVGYSTHEHPDRTEPVMLAVGKGALVFEKHVGLPTADQPLNSYSATPGQVRSWLSAAARALAMCGDEAWPIPSAAEQESLQSLRRGVWADRDIERGEAVSETNTRFAFPAGPGQLTANQWSKYARFTAREPIAAGEPVLTDRVDAADDRSQVLDAVDRVKAVLRSSHIVVPGKSELEISHHYGMEKFADFGLTMVTVVNREYCKKLIVLLPGQAHPEQFHRNKEETFVVLNGRMTVWLDGEPRTVEAGDVITVQREVRHRFHTDEGIVFEEISSTHHPDDSFYTDPAIARNPRRKTFLTHWM